MNFNLPPEIHDAFEEARKSAGLNDKQKWIAISAAMLLFIELSPEARGHALGMVSQAPYGLATFDQLVSDARSGKFSLRKRIGKNGKR